MLNQSLENQKMMQYLAHVDGEIHTVHVKEPFCWYDIISSQAKEWLFNEPLRLSLHACRCSPWIALCSISTSCTVCRLHQERVQFHCLENSLKKENPYMCMMSSSSSCLCIISFAVFLWRLGSSTRQSSGYPERAENTSVGHYAHDHQSVCDCKTSSYNYQ